MSRRSYIRIEKVRNKKSIYKCHCLNALLFFFYIICLNIIYLIWYCNLLLSLLKKIT